ncbi:MAG TPA: helix-turn-helix transcriptional regulator [Jiangellaceae bacterium]|nr:helix-turn-helix transcriptional regulator [Jiangellaceae bacterium]
MSADESEWDPHLRELGEYIRLQRQMADLSLRRLAELTHVSNAYLSQIERGLHQPSLRVLHSIAQALNVSADTLLLQAGLIDSAGTAKSGTRTDTETAIMNDENLTDEERDALVRVYRSFRHTQGGG